MEAVLADGMQLNMGGADFLERMHRFVGFIELAASTEVARVFAV
jgi:hypothetical protein